MTVSARRWLAIASALAASLASAAGPFTRSFDAVPIKHTPSMESGIALEGAKFLAPGSLRAALLLDANVELFPLSLGGVSRGALIPFRTDAHALVAYQPWRRVELSLDVPVTVYQQDNFRLLSPVLPQAGVAAVGLGDLRGQGRFSILSEDRFPLSLAAIAELRVPTGDQNSFLGDASVTFSPRLAAERTFGPVRVLANVGARFREPGQFLNLYVGNELLLGAGAIWEIPYDLRVIKDPQLVGEMNVATPLDAPFTIWDSAALKTPWELQLGLRGRVAHRWGVELSLGKGVGLGGSYGRELARAGFAVTYQIDPTSSVEKDQDGDGISDADDRCPTQPEDKDGFEDGDGCPDPDNDNDGLADGADMCPTQAGPAELDGCPDRDGDEIPDVADKCPDEPGAPEKEGCPYDEPSVVLEADRIRIRGNILFETGSARIQRLSYGMLDQVYKVLADNPDIGPVQVEGHTDNRGGRDFNLRLSGERAKSVVEYLISKGIDAKRLRARGFGFDKPVAKNATQLGRSKNRRVEFNLVDKAGGSAGAVQQVQQITTPDPDPPGGATSPAPPR